MTSFEEGSRINTSTGSGNNEIEDVKPSSVLGGFKWKHETSFIWGYMTRVDVDGVKKANKHQATTYQINTLFDPNVGKAKVAKMIIMYELPLCFVEYTGFREMVEYWTIVLVEELEELEGECVSSRDCESERYAVTRRKHSWIYVLCGQYNTPLWPTDAVTTQKDLKASEESSPVDYAEAVRASSNDENREGGRLFLAEIGTC
ncbi:hypothetical protein EZV62_002712 [Acer yangbiense]|uniref:Uncharacterized protein n=1 Tax=Acer yangbiense TaxID=1000413 RepID=A0A5C7IY61_9ROSI|nr:hypothetical protein EZV62_002712 [Acer yangbiense]